MIGKDFMTKFTFCLLYYFYYIILNYLWNLYFKIYCLVSLSWCHFLATWHSWDDFYLCFLWCYSLNLKCPPKTMRQSVCSPMHKGARRWCNLSKVSPSGRKHVTVGPRLYTCTFPVCFLLCFCLPPPLWMFLSVICLCLSPLTLPWHKWSK